MRRSITLYIRDKAVDMDGQSFILYNYAFNDLTNPAIVKNSFSKQITLPRTDANEDIFSHFGKADRLTGDGYDVMAKEPFTIFNAEGEIMESGYVKLESVSRNGFAVTLYGGLGSLLYGLATRVDGTPRDLSDLMYSNDFGNTYGADDPIDLDIATSWECLRSSSFVDLEQVFNFAPMYNGYPADFDAKSAVVKNGVFANIPGYIIKDGVRYEPKSGTSGKYTIGFAADKTEWEVSDIRNYLQRPVARVKAVLDAISDSSLSLTGKNLTIDPSVRNLDIIQDVWMTLPMLKTEYRPLSSPTLRQFLDGTMTPADFLVAVIKAFGLVLTAKDDGLILMTRDAFFSADQSDIIDMTERIDTSSDIKVAPVFADSRYFDFALPGVDGDTFGDVTVDTNYPFNDNHKNVFEGTPLKSAPATILNSLSFAIPFLQSGGVVTSRFLPQSSYETVKARMYRIGTDEKTDLEIAPVSALIARLALYQDWTERLVCQDKDGKAKDGSGVFLLFNGMEDTPQYEYADAQGVDIVFPQLRYYLTVYDADRIALNDGKDCWDNTHEGTYFTSLPSFGTYNDSLTITMSSRLGRPGIYERMWKRYIGDLYNRDTVKMTCKADLTGIRVSQMFLSRFFFYGGAIWVLNAVHNYSLTTYDAVECEFIKVQDIDNYANGQ